MADAPDLSPEAVGFLIEKRGLYYRPDARGYTGLKREAGRYSFEEAAERVGPNGPDGPQDGMGMWREDEAPDFSSRCPWDLKLIEKTRQEAVQEMANDLARERAAREAAEAKLAEVREVLGKLPSGEWKVASSCSFRRLTAYDDRGRSGPDGGVLCGVVQRDGHPDLSMPESQLQALCNLVNGGRALINNPKT